MKKLILAFAAIVITAGAFAQADSTKVKTSPRDVNKNQNHNMQHNPVDRSHSDGIMMQNGKIMKVENGQMSVLERDVTLSNGTKIMRDGNYIKKDGSKVMLKEGQRIDMSGNLVPVKVDKDKTMYLVPDSIRNQDF